MKINHIAIYSADIERSRAFYEKYFNGVSNEKYHNTKTGLQTYFIDFSDGARLEIMTRKEVCKKPFNCYTQGYAHLAFTVGSRDDVDMLTQIFASDGYIINSMPRVTGDGYYESCILDPDGNLLELVAQK